MMANFIKKLKTRTMQNDGFTLIEVILSIAVLSLVSIALLEMFTVSTRTNVQANEMDKAKSLCVEASEEYKADPVDPNPYDLTDPVGSNYLKGFHISTSASGVTTYTKYFDRNWAETAADEAVYVLEIVSEKDAEKTLPTSYYPANAVKSGITGEYTAIEVKSNKTIWLEPDGASDCTLSVDSDIYNIDTGRIIYSDSAVARGKTAYIPIHLDCSEITDNAVITIRVENKIEQLEKDGEYYEAIADIYLCDVDDREMRDARVETVTGITTENKISTTMQRMVKYNADISVKVKSDGHTLAESRVEKYWVDN